MALLASSATALRGLCAAGLRQPAVVLPHCYHHHQHLANRARQQQQQPLVRAMATPAVAAAAPKYWLLSYQYVPDILERRGPYREAHLAGARQHLDAGRLVAAGAVGDPVEGATFFFKDISKEEIEAFVAADPYVVNGLVPSWSLKPFAVVVGSP